MKEFEVQGGNLIKILQSPEEMFLYWDDLLEGYQAMCRNKLQDSVDTFTRRMMTCLFSDKYREGGLHILTSKNGKFLGYGAAYDSTGRCDDHKSMFVYALYSNQKYVKAVQTMLQFAEDTAREFGYKELITTNGRFSGAIFRWYENRMGFKRLCITFRKELL
jgi:hypothetical protein